MKLEFCTFHYYFSHSCEPRGRGTWAFCPRYLKDPDRYLDHSKFAPANMTYTEAKAWASKQDWPAGTRSLTVLP